MKCRVRSSSKPEVAWSRGAETVRASGRISMRVTAVKDDEYEIVLELKVRDTDWGSNEWGERERGTEIEVGWFWDGCSSLSR